MWKKIVTPGTAQAVKLLLAAEGFDFDELMAAHQQRQAQGSVGTKDCWLTLKEAMQHARVSRITLWRWIHGHGSPLKALKLSNARSGKVLISRLSLEALLESKRICKDME